MRPTIELAILTLQAIWSSNVSWLSMVTLRSFSSNTCSISLLYTFYRFVYMVFSNLPRDSTWHFFGLNLRSQVFDHSSSASISACRASASDLLWILLNTFVSSAKRNPSDLILSRISFIKIMNRIGPRTLPWGIPLGQFLRILHSP